MHGGGVRQDRIEECEVDCERCGTCAAPRSLAPVLDQPLAGERVMGGVAEFIFEQLKGEALGALNHSFDVGHVLKVLINEVAERQHALALGGRLSTPGRFDPAIDGQFGLARPRQRFGFPKERLCDIGAFSTNLGAPSARFE
ncbi:MAG: hypothetical protein IT547_17190 [Hyphomonadaceae bacterium]|nr:hypothetical protein [Hyphomonadaceae bacterium]